MKISRRNFLGKAMKSLALVIVAPTLIAKYPVPALPQPGRPGGNQDKGEVIKFKKYDSPGKIAADSRFGCGDFKPYIEVKDYGAGETIAYQDLSTNECDMCAPRAKCTQTGKGFQDSMERWSRRLQAKLYKETVLSKLI